MSNKREKIKFVSEKDEDNVNKDFIRTCFLFTGMSYFFCILKYEKYYDIRNAKIRHFIVQVMALIFDTDIIIKYDIK